MDTSSIFKMDIVGIKEVDFDCAFCGNTSLIQYNIKINEEDEKCYSICLPCHNQIAKRISELHSKRRRNY